MKTLFGIEPTTSSPKVHPDTIETIKTAIGHIYQNKIFGKATIEWVRSLNQMCDFSEPIIKDVCLSTSQIINSPTQEINKPIQVNKALFELIFKPLYRWLVKYKRLLGKEIALTGSYAVFVKTGLLPIARFIYLSDIFANHPEYIDPVNYGVRLGEGTEGDFYKVTLNELRQNLAGCRNNLGTMYIQSLDKVVRNNEITLTPEEQIYRDYLKRTCEILLNL